MSDDHIFNALNYAFSFNLKVNKAFNYLNKNITLKHFSEIFYWFYKKDFLKNRYNL